MTSQVSTHGLVELAVLDIFADHSYQVPLYQRAYAWTVAEIHTLLVDIQDARRQSQIRSTGSRERKYYIGSLVVDTSYAGDDVIYEVVDGQQRLTTLFVILSVAPDVLGVTLQSLPHRDALLHQTWSALLADKLTYEGRHDAREDLRRLAQRGAQAIGSLQTDGIREAAKVILAAASLGAESEGAGTVSIANPVHSAAESPVFTAADLQYLLHHVVILRATLPPRTDLNHYFEVMNTRGEQLEKHEILKARLMSALVHDPVEQAIFSQIWDACSILDRHIQVQFSPGATSSPSERTAVFGESWDRFVPKSSAELFETLRGGRSQGHPTGSTDNADSRVDLSEILNGSSSSQPDSVNGTDADESGSYGAIIDFPNLLLHVLKIFREENFEWDVDIDSTPGHVRLEDKYLLEEFNPAEGNELGDRNPFDAEAVRDFAFLLLRTRFLLDTYVIRTQASLSGEQEENWVLHRAYGARQRGGKTLQLSARNTFGGGEFDDDDDSTAVQRQVLLLQSMFQVTDTRRQSKYFLFVILQWLNRQNHQSPVRGRDFINLLESSERDRLAALYRPDRVDLGTKVQNFLFNALDYELWKLASDRLRVDEVLNPRTEVGRLSAKALANGAGKFRFRYRTSVEHFYPREPALSEGHERLPSEVVDRFGNLCIMSRSENSKRSNLMPEAKAKQFASSGQSLNFQLMAAVAQDHKWNRTEIDAHGQAMTRLLEEVIDEHRRAAPESSV